VKAFNAGSSVKTKTRELFNNIQTYGIKTAILSMSKDSLIEMVASFGTLALLWMGSVMIAEGTLTLGSLMAFYTMLGYFLSPIQNVMELQNTLQAAVVAAGRLRDILDRTKENTASDAQKASFRNGDIIVENVSFRYGNRFLVLDDLSASIRQGESTAIVGPSGCGKTTVTKLLMGFYTPEQGAVRIGGQDVRTVDLEDLRRNVAYVPQDVTMFTDTIRNNLLLGNSKEISDAQIEAVLEAAGCDFVKDMPFGLDTLLEENGSNISGGQRQRLAIARALLRNPAILVLDEATSALDTMSERKLQKSLKHFDPTMTVIMVAHRLNSIRNCDRILVLDHGTLVEEGTHTQLMEHNGLYATMYNSMS
jgi:ATP-binding cassette subfamily B protein